MTRPTKDRSMARIIEVPDSPLASAFYSASFKDAENAWILRGLGLHPDDLNVIILFRGERWRLLGIDTRRKSYRIVLKSMSSNRVIAAEDTIVTLIAAARIGYRLRLIA